MTTLRLLPLLCLLAATATCRHEFPGNGDKSVADRGADRPASDLLPSDRNPDAPRDMLPSDGPADGPHADEGKLDGPKPKADKPKVDAPKVDAPKSDGPKVDASKVDASKLDARKDISQGPDQVVMCGITKAGSCYTYLLCGTDGKWHVDCLKCGCPLNGTCVNITDCKVLLSPTADSYTDNRPYNPYPPPPVPADANYGTSTLLELSKYPTQKETIYINFPVQSSIPSIAVVTSAQLKLYVKNWGGRAVDAEIQLVGGPWGETTITANNAPSTLVGGPVSPPLKIGFWQSALDVTQHVKQWLGAASGTVHGLRLEAVDTSRPRPANCYSDAGVKMCGYGVAPFSREHSDPAQRPVLEVTYK